MCGGGLCGVWRCEELACVWGWVRLRCPCQCVSLATDLLQLRID